MGERELQQLKLVIRWHENRLREIKALGNSSTETLTELTIKYLIAYHTIMKAYPNMKVIIDGEEII